jgi:dTDP-4-dehydrorhamnose 3,5-epimerase
MPFKFTRLEIPDLILIEPKIYYDERGAFFETYKESEFKQNGIVESFLQDNYSISKKGVLRGLHYQINPMAQGKLVRVIKGKAWDVAVDIRKSSKTYLKWTAVELSEENKFELYIPAGFAHGFVALENDTHFVYKCTNEYSSIHEAGIRWDDVDLNIHWPVKKPIISEKDLKLPDLKNAKFFD